MPSDALMLTPPAGLFHSLRFSSADRRSGATAFRSRSQSVPVRLLLSSSGETSAARPSPSRSRTMEQMHTSVTNVRPRIHWTASILRFSVCKLGVGSVAAASACAAFAAATRARSASDTPLFAGTASPRPTPPCTTPCCASCSKCCRLEFPCPTFAEPRRTIVLLRRLCCAGEVATAVCQRLHCSVSRDQGAKHHILSIWMAALSRRSHGRADVGSASLRSEH